MEVPEKIEMRKIIPVVARISAGKSKLLNIKMVKQLNMKIFFIYQK